MSAANPAGRAGARTSSTRRSLLLAVLIAAAFAAALALLRPVPGLDGEAALQRDAGSGPSLAAAAAPADAGTNEYARATLAQVERTLAEHAPTPRPSRERLGALAALGTVLLRENAAALPALQDFYRRRIEAALADMRATRVDSGAAIWKMYNHGFVVRTASVTLCFDLVRPGYLGGFGISRELMQSVVAQCDALFLSHAHADHVESFVARTFMEQGKPVVAPEQVGFRGPLESHVTRLERRPGLTQVLAARGGSVQLRVVVFPGHQGADIDNNVVLVTTPEDVAVAHTGDQWDRYGDFAWIDRVWERHRVDVLLPNGWTWNIARLVRGFDPALVIPGHEYELGHEVEKRQTFSLSFERRSGSGHYGGSPSRGYPQPLIVMAWGERYRYLPADFPRR